MATMGIEGGVPSAALNAPSVRRPNDVNFEIGDERRLSLFSSIPTYPKHAHFYSPHSHAIVPGGFTKERDHLLRLALAHEAVVDEHASEPVAHRCMDEDGRDGRIDAAREATDDPPFPVCGRS